MKNFLEFLLFLICAEMSVSSLYAMKQTMSLPDAYEELGLSKSASQEDIKKNGENFLRNGILIH